MNDSIEGAAQEPFVEVFPHPAEAMSTMLAAAALTEPLHKTADGRLFAVLPDGYAAREVTDPYALPPRPQRIVTVDDRDSAINYTNRFRELRTILLADIDAGTIKSIIDWHMEPSAVSAPSEQVGSCEHVCCLKLRASEEFKRWDAFEGRMHPQDEFAAFLEENAADIVDPESGVIVEISRDLELTQGSSFKSSVRLDNGDRAFRYETDTVPKGEIAVPSRITLQIPIYHGEPPIELNAAFRFRATSDGLLLGIEWRRVEYARQAVFREIAHKVSEETGVPLFYGR